LGAVQAVDLSGSVPISDIEKLIDVESRLGESRAVTALSGAAPLDAELSAAEALIDLALKRLDGLDALVANSVSVAVSANANVNANAN
ncbi:hypothetical protein ACVBEH_29345, partial [Roseateles sp. GG27B]